MNWTEEDAKRLLGAKYVPPPPSRMQQIIDEALESRPFASDAVPERVSTQTPKARIAQTRCTEDGFDFDSELERDRYRVLRLMERAKEIRCLRVHPSWDHLVNDQKVFTYTADFCYWENDHWVIEDVKPKGCLKSAKDKRAMISDVFRLKKAIIEAQEGISITIVTQDSSGCWVTVPFRGRR